MIFAVLELTPAAAHHAHGHRAGVAWAIAIAVMVVVLLVFAAADMAHGRADRRREP